MRKYDSKMGLLDLAILYLSIIQKFRMLFLLAKLVIKKNENSIITSQFLKNHQLRDY